MCRPPSEIWSKSSSVSGSSHYTAYIQHRCTQHGTSKCDGTKTFNDHCHFRQARSIWLGLAIWHASCWILIVYSAKFKINLSPTDRHQHLGSHTKDPMSCLWSRFQQLMKVYIFRIWATFQRHSLYLHDADEDLCHDSGFLEQRSVLDFMMTV
jgi:hypothetical protein